MLFSSSELTLFLKVFKILSNLPKFGKLMSSLFSMGSGSLVSDMESNGFLIVGGLKLYFSKIWLTSMLYLTNCFVLIINVEICLHFVKLSFLNLIGSFIGDSRPISLILLTSSTFIFEKLFTTFGKL